MSSVAETPTVVDGLMADDLRRLYRTMTLGRLLAERFWILSRQGKTHFVITSQGHEAAQVGSASALVRGTDYVYTYYRSMSVALTLGFTPYELFLSVLAKRDDPYSGGRQLPNHPSRLAWRVPTHSSSIATQIPHAVGSAYAARVLGQECVSIAYFGEGATSKGDFHEAASIASIHKLPVIFFCENNHYSISVPEQYEIPPGGVVARAAGYAMRGIQVDGLDPVAVYHATREAREIALAGGGPTLIEALCVRLGAHSSDDNDRYRTDAMRETARIADPLPRFHDRLITMGLWSEEEDTTMREEITTELRESMIRAEAAPAADPADARRHLFAEPAAPASSAEGDAR